MSRGLWIAMSARSRRSLTLLWIALFMCSLAMQYVQLAVPAPVLAVHDEAFQLDGNAVDDGPGDDWNNHPGADAFTFVVDPVNSAADLGFTGGGSKDDLNTSSWQWVKAAVSPDKDDITNAYAALYGDNLYFGADRFASNGDAALGFWFLKNGIGLTGTTSGGFTPVHSVGDLLVISHFENGGTTSQVQLYKWVGSGGDTNGTLDLLGAGVTCTAPPVDDIACAVANSANATAPWAYAPKSGTAGTFPANSFLEGGLDLVKLYGGNPPCFSSFLVETRTSQSVDATLKDFATGAFNTCVPPTIVTQASGSTADFGQSITDSATLSGSDGPASGSVKFLLCAPAQVTGAGCPTGGTQIGGAIAVTTSANGGTATSAAYAVGQTAAAVGKYCWRVEYTPDAASQYLIGSHTNATTECFTVAPATIDIDKVANPAGPVDAGTTIGFDIVVTNTGSGTALGVSVSDNLPSGVDWTLGATSGSTTGLSCAITGAVGSEVLGCTKASLGAGQSFSVRVTAPTDATDCGTVNNSAAVATSNDGSDTDPASVVVLCPDVTVAKTPDGGSVNAGATATFTIVVTNLGPGSAAGVTLTDNLPAGYTWTGGGADFAGNCSINTAPNPDVLSCSFGTMASGATRTITLSAPTSGANCATIPNTATVGASNEPTSANGNNSDAGSIDVLCAQIDIDKVANPVGPVNAGDSIGFDITVTNNGDGTATGVSVTDALPAGVVWTADAPTGDTTGVSCSIDTAPNPDVLTCTDASMAAGDTFTVRIHGLTDAADCGTVNNTASVSTTNDGSDSDGASVVVLCPDLTVLKVADADPINAGDPIGFTITVTNNGPGAAYGVTLTDTLPAGITWSEDSAACSIASGVLSCAFGTLADDAQASVHLTGTTTAANCGTINNTATVSGTNEPQSVTTNNSSSDSVVVNCPDVTVLKVADADPISAGDPIGFTITVTNLGPGVAKSVTLTDTLPAGIAWAENSSSCSIASGVLSCSFGDMAAGASAGVHLTGTTDAGDCGTIPNTATVGAANEASAQQGNNASSDSVVVLCPDLEIVKDGNGPLSAGEEAVFTITVTNHGPGVAKGVTLTDTLPTGVNWSEDSASCSIASGVLSCAFGDLASGASRSVTLSGDTDAGDCGTIPNLASVSASNEDTATDQYPNSDDATIVVDCPEIVITKTADDAVVNAGDQIGFTITVTNTGDGNAFAVAVTDTLPAGFAWSEGPDAAAWSISSGVLSFGPATLASGASTSVHIVATTDAADCGQVPNTAFLTYSGGSGSDDDSITVECPDVTVIKSGNGPIGNGDTATFVITAWNQGPGVAYAVTLTDQLPDGDWTLGGADADDCAIDGDNLLTCDFGDLAASGEGSSRSITVSKTTTTDDCGTIPNEVTVGAANEASADSDDNSDSATIQVTCTFGLLIVKANDAPLASIQLPNGTFVDLPTAKEGSTLTYTLDYDLVLDPVTSGVITDVLPIGVTYVPGSATNDAQFTFQGYDSSTRTLTWTAPSVTVDGTLSYQATVDKGASELPQPLINVAVIDSAQTDADDDDSQVFVPTVPLAATGTPRVTLPPTDALGGAAATSNPGFSLMLILLALGGLVLTIGYVTPVPASVRERERRSRGR